MSSPSVSVPQSKDSAVAASQPHNRGMKDSSIRPGRFWWIPVVRGIFAVLLGIAVLVTKGSRASLANFIGIYWLLSGIVMIRWALTVRWKRGSRIGLAAGTLSALAGAVILLRHPLQHLVSPTLLINALAIAAVLMGCLRLFGAFEIERQTGRRWTYGGLALGSVEVVIGLALLFARSTNARGLSIAFATWGLVGGTLLLIEGSRLHRLAVSEGMAPQRGSQPG